MTHPAYDPAAAPPAVAAMLDPPRAPSRGLVDLRGDHAEIHADPSQCT
ncbi:hypothetical protein [Nocardia sp. NPDC049707]